MPASGAAHSIPVRLQVFLDKTHGQCRVIECFLCLRKRYASIMLCLIQAPNLVLATLWADWLRAEGIDASVQREYLPSAAGELPPDQCLPEVWIDDPLQETRARELLNLLRRPRQRRWLCVCGELVEGGFEQCWNCEQMMPEGAGIRHMSK